MDTGKSHLISKYRAAVLALISAVLWGSAFPVLKLSYAEMHMVPEDLSAKVVLAGIRFFLASVLLFGLMLFGRQKPWVGKRLWFWLVLSGLLQISLQYFFFYNGLAHTTGMKGAVLSSGGTFFVFILAHFFYANDKLNWQKGVGLATGLAGILLVNYGKSFTPEFSWQGEGFLIIGGLVSAFGTILSKRLSGSVHALALTAWQMLLGSLLLIAVGVPGLKLHSMVFTAKAWWLLGYSAFLSAAAFSLYYSVLKHNKAGEISVYMFMIPVSGAILSALFVPGEKLTVFMLGALLLVALGIAAVNYRSTPEVPVESTVRTMKPKLLK